MRLQRCYLPGLAPKDQLWPPLQRHPLSSATFNYCEIISMQRKIPVKTLAILLLRVDNSRQMVSAPCLPHNDSWARVLSSHKGNSFNCHPLTMSPNESLLGDLFPMSRDRAPKRLLIILPTQTVGLNQRNRHCGCIRREERAFLETQGREEAMNFFSFFLIRSAFGK